MSAIPKWLGEEIDDALDKCLPTRRPKRHVVAWLYSYGRDLCPLPKGELHGLIVQANEDATSALSERLAQSYGL